MRIDNMARGNSVYTSNAYLVRGDWNALADRNALVDTGRDPVVLDNLEQAATGVGKPRVEQVVLTHTHYDHVGMLEAIRERYRPEVYAFSTHFPGADRILRDGQHLLLGDSWFQVLHVPCHSQDSICLYHPSTGVLFSGDTPLKKAGNGGAPEEVRKAIAHRLAGSRRLLVYPGHGKEHVVHRGSIPEGLDESAV